MPLLTGTVLQGGQNPLDGNQPYDLEGNCGYFARNVEWTIDQAPPREGIIFQLVRRAAQVERYTSRLFRLMNGPNLVAQHLLVQWVAMSAGDIDTYVANNPQLALYPLYWEAWKVARGSTHPTYAGPRRGQADDCFSLTSLVPRVGAPVDFQNTTRGRYLMRGAAFFMETNLDPVNDFGFSNAGNSPAGALPFRAVADCMLLPNMRIDSDVLRHETIVAWDSTVLDQDNTYGVSQVRDTMVSLAAGPVGRDLTPLLA